MLRCVATMVVLSACGRISFDPSTRVGDAQGVADAPHLLTDAPVLNLEAGACPSGYVAFAASCYRMSYKGSGGGGGWLDAELACEADGVGSHLVVIGSEPERVGLVGSVNVIDSTWIGTTKRQTAAYRTVIDTDAYLALGTQTEPSEDCLSINNSALMYLHSCPDVRDNLCEFDGAAAVPSSY